MVEEEEAYHGRRSRSNVQWQFIVRIQENNLLSRNSTAMAGEGARQEVIKATEVLPQRGR